MSKSERDLNRQITDKKILSFHVPPSRKEQVIVFRKIINTTKIHTRSAVAAVNDTDTGIDERGPSFASSVANPPSINLRRTGKLRRAGRMTIFQNTLRTL
jgi:hypothetical protein